MFSNIRADIQRYVRIGNYNGISKIKMFVINEPIWFLLVFRIGTYVRNDFNIPILKQLMYLICFILHKLLSILLGIQIPLGTNIGKGLYLPHFGSIVLHQNIAIGEHCNIGQNVTIGIAGRGNKKGVPSIGNYVYIAPGAKIIGKIKIGNNVMIGANAVVTKDIPDNSVVAGIPAQIISYKGWDTEDNPYQNID